MNIINFSCHCGNNFKKNEEKCKVLEFINCDDMQDIMYLHKCPKCRGTAFSYISTPNKLKPVRN